MNSFEKFKTRQISQAESSQIMGGDYHTDCLTISGPDAFCIMHQFNLLADYYQCWNMVDQEARNACLDDSCDQAFDTCFIQ